MRTRPQALACFFIFAILLPIARPARAQQGGSSETAPVATVVTVLGPKFTPPPAISREDIVVYEDKNRLQVTGWIPAQGDRAWLDLAIVIDDASRSDLSLQFKDITSFLEELPQTTRTGIFYADNGTVIATSEFTNDHAAAAKKIRIPLGNIAAYTSIYLSVMDLISRWPVSQARREILLISDGIDRFRGDPFSPDIDQTIERAQKAGIMIHTLYATGVGRVARNTFRVNFGQSNLSQIADATGGEAFFQGLQTPLSFEPYLKQLDLVLKNQYFLTFNAVRGKKADLHKIRTRTEQHNVELSHADKVLVPGQE